VAQSTTVSASVRLRPTRIGFLVRPDDMAAIRQVMQVCTCLWGGGYNPIIPVCTALPEAWRDPPFREITGPQLAHGYIRFFEPDVFIETHDGLAAEVGVVDGELDFGEPRTIPIVRFQIPILTRCRGRSERAWSMSIGAEAVIAWLDEHGVKAIPSDSGRIAEQVLLSVGGIRGTTLLADRDTLRLLNDMAKSVRRYADRTIVPDGRGDGAGSCRMVSAAAYSSLGRCCKRRR
jgi:hypothetical protein